MKYETENLLDRISDIYFQMEHDEEIRRFIMEAEA